MFFTHDESHQTLAEPTKQPEAPTEEKPIADIDRALSELAHLQGDPAPYVAKYTDNQEWEINGERTLDPAQPKKTIVEIHIPGLAELVNLGSEYLQYLKEKDERKNKRHDRGKREERPRGETRT